MTRSPRASTSRFAILGVLSLGAMSGYDVKKLIERSIAHFWNESYGQIYPSLNRLAAEGKLVLAGPFADDGLLRGIYIFDVPTVAEAEALTNSDPAIKAGQLVMELHPWYGSAALLMVNEVHARIEKTKP